MIFFFFGDFSGAYDEEESAARAYDLVAIKYWGTTNFTNFPVRMKAYNIRKLIRHHGYFFQVSDYETEIEIMQSVTKEEHLAL